MLYQRQPSDATVDSPVQ